MTLVWLRSVSKQMRDLVDRMTGTIGEETHPRRKSIHPGDIVTSLQMNTPGVFKPPTRYNRECWKELKHSKFNVHQNANENNEITVEVEDILSALVDEMRLPLFVSSDDTNDGNDDPNRMMVIENAFDELESERQDFEAQVEQEFKNFGNAAAAHWNSDKDDDVQSFSTDDNNK